MINRLRDILLYDKLLLGLAAGILSAVVVIIVSSIYAGNYESRNIELNSQLDEFQSLSREILNIKTIVDSKEEKIRLKKPAGIVSTLEQILTNIGLEAQVIKPLGNTKAGEFSEENAELQIQDTDLNSIVNLLYKIDISPAPLKIKNASVRSTFEDPDKFIFTLTVSLMSKGS